ncbi:hypothetical protein Taro_012663 [Colocasia esculenta]|uniref:PLAT domain-containing protein n=1 Tax=Colocasia esculenta TaxID=4460 RepID=A0A843U4M2_COLES|nr:hypothetical protein [Colocasia esculenta]
MPAPTLSSALPSPTTPARARASSSPTLEKWGQMGTGYDYFERGHLDFFSGQASCLSGPPCWLMLAHDDSGNKPGWYVDYVLVTVKPLAVNRAADQHLFKVYQWLAIRDESPNQLATTRDDCRSTDGNIIRIPTSTL